MSASHTFIPARYFEMGVNCKSQIINHPSQVTNHQSTFINHKSTIKNHQSKIPNQKSSITLHQSQITFSRSYTYVMLFRLLLGNRTRFVIRSRIIVFPFDRSHQFVLLFLNYRIRHNCIQRSCRHH